MGIVLAGQAQQASEKTATPIHLAPLATNVLQLLQAAQDAIDRDANTAKVVIAAAAKLIQKEFGDVHVEADCGGLPAWQQRRLRAYIDERFKGPIPIATLASLTNLSVSHFARAFKQSFGVTPHTFVLSRRLKHTLDLMLDTDKSLAEVSYEAGFADQSHFCRVFRQRFRESPAAWRRARSADARGDTVGWGSARHIVEPVAEI